MAGMVLNILFSLTLYVCIAVEAAIMLVRSLTSGDWPKLISSKRDYKTFFNEFV